MGNPTVKCIKALKSDVWQILQSSAAIPEGKAWQTLELNAESLERNLSQIQDLIAASH